MKKVSKFMAGVEGVGKQSATQNCFGGVGGVYLELAKEDSVSKYDELKQRIDNVTGWDKEADDILQEIHMGNKRNRRWILIDIDNSGWIQVRDCDGEKQIIRVKLPYSDQCEKLSAFKEALLWLLDHSGIKKDEKQTEIDAIRKQVEELQEKLKKLEV